MHKSYQMYNVLSEIIFLKFTLSKLITWNLSENCYVVSHRLKLGAIMENCISFKQMCEKFGCTARTLRHYEEIELLFPQKEGRSRWYCRREIARMKLIMRGRRFEFSLEGIRQWLLMYDGEKNNIGLHKLLCNIVFWV